MGYGDGGVKGGVELIVFVEVIVIGGDNVIIVVWE